MDTSQSTTPPTPAMFQAPSFQEIVSDSIRYWEPRRVGYNLVLVSIVLGWVGVTWPHFRGAFTWRSALAVFVLAVLANVAYCAAYLVDLTAQYSAFRNPWRRRRWVLWVVGVAFAGVITFYWIADEIYPSVANGPAAPNNRMERPRVP
jgi:hypothetical protein